VLFRSPKLLTQDQKTASIEAGEEIPFQEKTRGGGSTVVFKKAVLSLEVTPRILHRNQLLLDLKVNQDAPGIRVNDALMIDTRQIETHVQVKSGQTLVLGGILEDNKWGQKEGIPFLSEIPLLGRLFECRDKSTDHRELLVFITPTIVGEEN
jgi:type IV pilus assembly protein PilQ